MNTCRGCGAAIQFGRTSNGKTMPIDTVASDDGNVVFEANGVDVTVLTNEQKLTDTRPRFMSHFATCPDRQKFKRPDKKTALDAFKRGLEGG